MKVKDSSIYYVIESGEMLKIAKEYSAYYSSSHLKIMDYIESLGAEKYWIGFDGKLQGVMFKEGCLRDDFIKPARNGGTRPKKNSKVFDEFCSYSKTSPYKVISNYTKCPTSISYEYDGGSGVRGIGHTWSPLELAWYSTSGPFLLKIPNVKPTIDKIKEENEGVVFKNDEDKWVMNEDGLRQILPEEWDLMVAKYLNQKESK
jgi:hypothetical protein